MTILTDMDEAIDLRLRSFGDGGNDAAAFFRMSKGALHAFIAAQPGAAARRPWDPPPPPPREYRGCPLVVDKGIEGWDLVPVRPDEIIQAALLAHMDHRTDPAPYLNPAPPEP